MSRGALLFAFNSPTVNYYSMAEYTAKRINYFLDLPVTVITDNNSIPLKPTYNFDKIILVEPEIDNKKDNEIWINKGRYKAYDLSPYDETILLDTDYMVNSNILLKTFDTYIDFCCHDNASFLMNPHVPPEMLSAYSFKMLWATVITFKKTKRSKQIFECLKMVQQNYSYYANIHKFLTHMYRNDYGLTLALRIANGHSTNMTDIIPWNLLHIGKRTSVYSNSAAEFNTEYTVIFDNWKRDKIKKEYIMIKDTDFHTLNKDIFLEIING